MLQDRSGSWLHAELGSGWGEAAGMLLSSNSHRSVTASAHGTVQACLFLLLIIF